MKPGYIFAKEHCDSPEVEVCMLKQGHSIDSLPPLPDKIQPRGLDVSRQWYLYENIRPFCGSVKASSLLDSLPLVSLDDSSSPSPPSRMMNSSICSSCNPVFTFKLTPYMFD